MAPQAKDLEPIKDKKIAARYLRYTIDLREPISCFLDSASCRFEANALSFSDPDFHLAVEMGARDSERLTPEQNKALETARIRLSFVVQDVLFFAHAKVMQKKSRRLELQVDLPLFKLQRRDAMRIKILDEHKARITVGGKAYIPHDLSASGLSFVIMQSDEEKFSAGEKFDACRLEFSGIDAKVDLEVIGVRELKKDSARLLKVGFRFRNLSPALEQKLAREAYLHTSKIWSRWL